MIDREIGSYWVLKQIAQGHDENIYLGIHKTKDQEVVIRELAPSAFPDPAAKARFLRTVEFLRRAAPRHMVPIHSCQSNDEALVLFTDYLPETLEDILKKEGSIPLTAALGVTLALLEALQYLHRNKVVHGHISPATVFLTKEGIVKLGYFGAGATASDTDQRRYLPPETSGAEAPTAAGDLYAVGAMLSRMLGAEGAFPTAESTPDEAGAPLSPAVKRVLQKALAVEAGERFDTAEAFADAIKHMGRLSGIDVAERKPAPVPSTARKEGLGILLGIMVLLLLFVVLGRHKGVFTGSETVRAAVKPRVASEIPPAQNSPTPPVKPLPLAAPPSEGVQIDAPTPVTSTEVKKHPAHHTKKKSKRHSHSTHRLTAPSTHRETLPSTHAVTVPSTHRINVPSSRRAMVPVPIPTAAPQGEMEPWSIRK